MNFLADFMNNIKQALEEVLESRVYLYRFTLSEKKLDDLVSFGKINFISMYPIFYSSKEVISETQYRAFYGRIKIDFYYAYNYTDESESNFLDQIQLITEAIHKKATGNSYIVKGDISFSIDVALIANVVCHYGSCEVDLRSFELPDQVYIESLGQTSYKEVK